MMSRIEQLISEIEEYIDSCRFQALSNSKIIVNKEELEELLVELRLRIPDEIKKYQKIISQQETILGKRALRQMRCWRTPSARRILWWLRPVSRPRR